MSKKTDVPMNPYKKAWIEARDAHDGDDCYGGDWIEVIYLLMDSIPEEKERLAEEAKELDRLEKLADSNQ